MQESRRTPYENTVACHIDGTSAERRMDTQPHATSTALDLCPMLQEHPRPAPTDSLRRTDGQRPCQALHKRKHGHAALTESPPKRLHDCTAAHDTGCLTCLLPRVQVPRLHGRVGIAAEGRDRTGQQAVAHTLLELHVSCGMMGVK